MSLSRREFFNKSVKSGIALASIPAIISGCESVKGAKNRYSYLEKGDIILFQGDSITDAGREKELEMANYSKSFGTGYALIAGSHLLKSLPEFNLTIFNRGISGNKVYQLADRWQKDCIGLNPNIVSILIGVNDYWHKRNGRYDGTVEVYEDDYRNLLRKTKEELPEVKLIIGEPFALTNTTAVDESWSEPLMEYQEVAKRLSDEFGAKWVPFQSVFNDALNYAPATYWTTDGVHPSMAGAQLMAEAWLMAND